MCQDQEWQAGNANEIKNHLHCFNHIKKGSGDGNALALHEHDIKIYRLLAKLHFLRSCQSALPWCERLRGAHNHYPFFRISLIQNHNCWRSKENKKHQPEWSHKLAPTFCSPARLLQGFLYLFKVWSSSFGQLKLCSSLLLDETWMSVINSSSVDSCKW